MENIFKLLTKEELSDKNKLLFEKLERAFGKVPNLYNVLAYSENALDAYLKLEESPTSLTNQEIEAVNLVVSEVNSCMYCVSAHTVIAKSTGISEEQSLEIRAGNAQFNRKLDALVRLAWAVTERRGHVESVLLQDFFAVGYSKENLVDVLMLIGDRTISNLLHAITQVPIDFPQAKKIA